MSCLFLLDTKLTHDMLRRWPGQCVKASTHREQKEICNTQQEQIQSSQKQLAVATEKLKLADVTAIEAMTGYEEQKEKVKYLKERLAHAESYQKQLAASTEKLKLADVTAIEAMTGYEEQKEKVKYLKERLAHAESQIVEGDELRKKLHDTILKRRL